MNPRFGRYEVVSKLGEGAMAAVHLARDPVLTRFVAVKVLHRTVAATQVALKRFFNEARVVANVRNPHVVEVFDFGKEADDFYLVMEFVDGQSLQSVLKQLGSSLPLPDTLAAALLAQAAEGLEMAARHGVVHRDIKPENLLINTQGYLKIGDFGIAHLQDDSLTRTGAVLGSPLYMSPEQVRGAKPITSQSDMFSLGAVLYRCLAGAPPFTAQGLKDLYRSIATQPHRSLLEHRPDLDPGLGNLVDTLLRKDPAQRGGGPRWLRSELRAYLLARGVDDPMDLVARHLAEMSRRGIQTTWRLDPGAVALPRTVASTSPSPDSTLPGPDRTVPSTRQSVEKDLVPRRSRSGSRKTVRPFLKAAAACCALALAAATGYFFKTPPSDTPLAADTFDQALSREIDRLAAAGSQASAPGPSRFTPKGSSAPSTPAVSAPTSPTHTPSLTTSQPGVASSPSPHAIPAPATASDTSAHASAPDSPASSSTASLVIRSAPPFAEVFLDGQYIGVTPVRISALEAGRHRLLVRGANRTAFDTSMQVEPGSRTIQVRLGPGEVAYSESEE